MAGGSFVSRAGFLQIGEVAKLWAEETRQPPGPIGREIAEWLAELIFEGSRSNSDELLNAQMINAEVAANMRLYEVQPPELYEVLEERPPDETCFILKDEIEQFCEDRGHKKPEFWFPEAYAAISKSAARAMCRRWLRQESDEHPYHPPQTKTDYRKEALKRWKQLGTRGFDRIWDETVPEGWKRPGRRREPKGT